MSSLFEGIDINVVVRELWNNTRYQGINQHLNDSNDVIQFGDEEISHELSKNDFCLDYFRGKPIKVNFKTYPKLESWGYDRDAGIGTMEKIREQLMNRVE